MNRAASFIVGIALGIFLLVGGAFLAQAHMGGGGMGGGGMGGGNWGNWGGSNGGSGNWGGHMMNPGQMRGQGWGNQGNNQAPGQNRSPYGGYNRAPDNSPYRGGQDQLPAQRQPQPPQTAPDTYRR